MNYRTHIKKYYYTFVTFSIQKLLAILAISITLSQSIVDSNFFEIQRGINDSKFNQLKTYNSYVYGLTNSQKEPENFNDLRRSLRDGNFEEFLHDIVDSDLAETRGTSTCCRNRNDTCSKPIHLNLTLCYCDSFCQHANDCCPDYKSVCVDGDLESITPPSRNALLSGNVIKLTHFTPSSTSSIITINQDNIRRKCIYKGETYDIGTIFKDNCNLCTCQVNRIFKCDTTVCMIRPEIIKKINNSNKGWKASNYSAFWGYTLAEGKKYKLGVLPLANSLSDMNYVALTLGKDEILNENFDSRKKWGPHINPIRNQLNCGSSWAISAADVAGDRSGIIGMRKGLTTLSPQYLISCNKGRGRQLGCHGGHIDIAWRFLWKFGTVMEGCFPYTGADIECPINNSSSLVSKNADCLKNQSQFLKFTPPYKVPKNESSIRIEILSNGPVQATMVIRPDLFVYKSGIYRCPKRVKKGKSKKNIRLDGLVKESASVKNNSVYHSVRILGWGQLDKPPKTKYWIVANSWGQEWGENGTFRILRGQNDCEIENSIIGIWPRPKNSNI
ncbi:uncharacterized peptidase C1-like protein F26E4.3 [Gordionus sp. m RMFG-2023]|uniref:uncharacterized peptidase C1-like protein F26E4.3 n=1 Tax=Gordionus sp. m RMFG-2023 TaxID=3053472 RepID=UPI0031FE2FA1